VRVAVQWARVTPARILTLCLVAIAVTLGSGCGGGGGNDNAATTTTSTTKTQPAKPAAAGTTTVSMKEYAFNPSDVTVKRGGTVTAENKGTIAHNLTVEQGSKKVAGTSTFLSGKSEKLKVDLTPGKYKMLCTVPGHEQLGMKGTFTVK
jgi:plastocyanin